MRSGGGVVLFSGGSTAYIVATSNVKQKTKRTRVRVEENRKQTRTNMQRTNAQFDVNRCYEFARQQLFVVELVGKIVVIVIVIVVVAIAAIVVVAVRTFVRLASSRRR